MTVTSTNYSSIEEVWGDTFPTSTSSKTKKEKRKKIIDPICELYEMGNNNGYTENDLITYANNYFEKQEAEKGRGRNRDQKTMNDLVTVFDTQPSSSSPSHYRESPSRYVDINPHNTFYDVTENEDDMTHIRRFKEQSNVPKPSSRNVVESRYTPASSYNSKPTVENLDIEEYEDLKSNQFAFIDLLLYIVSGIILIFVMEQFVKIGILLQ
jgi:hypothetical protein